MKVIKPLSVGLLTRAFEARRRFHLGVAALTFVPMGDAPAIFAETAMWKFLGEELAPDQPLDMALPKPGSEFIIAGRAYAPGGVPVAAVRVTARLAGLSKSLFVVGDRHIENDRPTAPRPFTEMPIDWAHAYGGPKFPENPLGKGIEEAPLPGIGFRVPLTNIEDPKQPDTQRARRPAGFGPLDIAWPQRARHAGTYDDRWLREDFPGFARDVDWRVFSAAPEDQRFETRLRGDEDYAFENMHPEIPVLTGRLPGVRPRIFIMRKGSETLEEVALALTTVWFFPHRMRAVLIHHGYATVVEEDARDIERLVAGSEKLGEPRPEGHYQRIMEIRVDRATAATASLRDSDLVPADLMVPDQDIEASRKLIAQQALVQKRQRAAMEREIEASRALALSMGLDPDVYAMKPLPPEEPPPSLETLPAVIERAMAEAEKYKAESDREMAAQQAEIARAVQAGEIPPGAYDPKAAERMPSGPPAFSAQGQRRELEELAAQTRAGGGDASAIEAVLADPAMMATWVEAEEGLREAYRQSAHVQDPAARASPERQAEMRARLAAGGGRRLDLCGADLAGLDLSGLDLSEAWLDGANLAGARLEGTNLSRAVLAHANLEGARMSRADLTGVNLGRARVAGSDLSGAKLGQAILTGADLRNCTLAGAELAQAQFGDVRLEGAELTGADATGLSVIEGSLAGLPASGARLNRAVFLKADLSGADFSGSTMNSVAFVKVKGRGINFAGADLRKSVFVDGCDLEGSSFAGANLSEVNLRGANLARCDFSGVVADGADFSDCAMGGAKLDLLRARGALLIATDLRDAVATRSDFNGALLTRADLRGANVSDANFHEADLARIRVDSGTRAERIFQVRTRVHPRRTEP
jgi:uncharacterized protein YjbI with pentapeptide repeats